MCKITDPVMIARSVTCKGHAESGITCRGKAPWVAKASNASRRAMWKRSWPSSPRVSLRETAEAARSEGGDRGVRVGRYLARELELARAIAESGRILPRDPSDPRSDSGVVKTLDSSVLTEAKPLGIRKAQALTMIREQTSTGARTTECWVAEIGRTYLDHAPR